MTWYVAVQRIIFTVGYVKSTWISLQRVLGKWWFDRNIHKSWEILSLEFLYLSRFQSLFFLQWWLRESFFFQWVSYFLSNLLIPSSMEKSHSLRNSSKLSLREFHEQFPLEAENVLNVLGGFVWQIKKREDFGVLRLKWDLSFSFPGKARNFLGVKNSSLGQKPGPHKQIRLKDLEIKTRQMSLVKVLTKMVLDLLPTKLQNNLPSVVHTGVGAS